MPLHLAATLLAGAAGAGAAETAPCAGAVFSVAGPPLLSERLGADAIRLGSGTVAVRSGCAEEEVSIHTTREGDHVMRAVFTHCAVDATAVSLWLRLRDDCTKLIGRIGLLPTRAIRLFEATRISEESAAWPRACICEAPEEVPICSTDARAAAD